MYLQQISNVLTIVNIIINTYIYLYNNKYYLHTFNVTFL